MKVKAHVSARDIVGDISFHGETNSDNKSSERISELKYLLEGVFNIIERTEMQIKGRSEASARDIHFEIKELKKTIGLYVIGHDDYDVAKYVIDFNATEYAAENPKWTTLLEEITND